MMKALGIGNSCFESFIEDNDIYVDKTKYLYKMIKEGRYYFCSRPRRFGKSLTISTFEAIFKGKRDLFKGLYIDSTDYDWKIYPVIHLDFASCSVSDAESLSGWITLLFSHIAKENSIELDSSLPVGMQFYSMIEQMSEKDPVVILIDEYDRVLSNNIYNPKVEEIRQVLRSVYEVIKGEAGKIRFCFLTGVTKYAKLSIFSALNNLRDISFEEDYANMFGYTQKELEDNFSAYIDKGSEATGITRQEYLLKMKNMYDGYCFFPGTDRIYNPVSVGLFFSNGGKTFSNYWIDTGNTKFLMDIAKKINFSPVYDLKKPLKAIYLSTFDILDIVTIGANRQFLMALLLQTGYLTIDSYNQNETYSLRFPNKEVKQSFSERLVNAYLGEDAGAEYIPQDLRKVFVDGNTAKAMEYIKAVYAAVPYQLSDGFNEHGWHMSFFTMIMGAGIDINAEENTNLGRIDCSFETEKHIYVMELKKDKSAQEAINQIHEKGYADKFMDKQGNKTIHLVGINFSTEQRNIDDWEEEVVLQKDSRK